MTKTKTTPYDMVDYLSTAEDCAAYLDAALQKAGATQPSSLSPSATLPAQRA